MGVISLKRCCVADESAVRFANLFKRAVIDMQMASIGLKKRRVVVNMSEVNLSQSEGFSKAQKEAAVIAKDPAQVAGLVDQALIKTKAIEEKGGLMQMLSDLATLYRLIRAYYSGEYRELPWESIVHVVGAIIYFVSPIDLIPDFIPGLGYIDDAAVIAWVMVAIKNDINRFRMWENQGTLSTTP